MTATGRGEPGIACVPPQRRRGAALEDAIRAAAFAELSEAGYHAFRIEAVAARAQTGKASIYRRWPTKQELVMDALLVELPEPADLGIVADMDDSITTADALRTVARGVASVLAGRVGDVIRAVKFEAMADPALAAMIDDRFQAPRRAALLMLLRRGIERGEVRPDAATQVVADVLPAVLIHHVVMQREKVTKRDIEAIVEQVIIPLVEVR